MNVFQNLIKFRTVLFNTIIEDGKILDKISLNKCLK